MQVQSCLERQIGIRAIAPGMSSVEDDIEMVRALLRHTGLKAANVADMIGVANTTINRFANGSARNRLARETVARLKEKFPDFPGFAKEPDLPTADPRQDYIAIEILPSYVGAGGGGNGDGDIAYGMVPRRLVVDELRASPKDLLLIEVRGDSMEPDFWHGDQILIDRRDRNPIQPGPFALWDGEAYVIKLVERVPGQRGVYRVFSVNERYSAYEIEDGEQVIMGRPVWFGRRL
jgi:phage repressor protein C with HTH and peptisase S24 domain